MKNIVILAFLISSMVASGQHVKLVKDETGGKIQVLIDGKLFTSYCYPSNLEKPFLYPVNAPNGAIVTRGFPLEPRKGERIDHPHQVGLWFNYGNVNGLDFWNNSSAIPPEKKDEYGHIVVRKIVKAESGDKGTLEVLSSWENSKGNILLDEDATYIFSGDDAGWTIDHISILTASDGPVVFDDNKEGMFAIRVDRSLEMPSEEAVIFTDEKGNPTTVKAMDNTGVTGMYIGSNGKKGDEVWGTRNKWVILSGIQNGEPVSLAIFDNPKNTGFPAYFHARGYGLFSVNNLGQNSYDTDAEKVVHKLATGESLKLIHRFYVQSGTELTPDDAEKIFREFSNTY
jgi:hypothetical protein